MAQKTMGCPACGEQMQYRLGEYECDACGHKTAALAVDSEDNLSAYRSQPPPAPTRSSGYVDTNVQRGTRQH